MKNRFSIEVAFFMIKNTTFSKRQSLEPKNCFRHLKD